LSSEQIQYPQLISKKAFFYPRCHDDSRADPRGGKGGNCPPPPWPKKRKEEREEGMKERKIVSLNNFDI